jgi:hypothetical protein
MNMRLNVWAFALTTALVWGFGLFLLTWWIIMFDGQTEDPLVIGFIYRGYNVSGVGSLIGFVWAFCDGFVGGAIFAWLYNLITGRPAQKE